MENQAPAHTGGERVPLRTGLTGALDQVSDVKVKLVPNDGHRVSTRAANESHMDIDRMRGFNHCRI